MAPQLDIPYVSVTIDNNFIVPTIVFNFQVFNRAGERLILGVLYCDILLGDLYLKKETIIVSNLNVGQSQEVKIFLPITIDFNNVIYEKLLALNIEELKFLLVFLGNSVYQSGSTFNLSPAVFQVQTRGGITTQGEIEKEATLSIEKWKRMVSSYYKDITWIAVKRETYQHLKKLVDEQGFISFDEAIKKLLNKSE